MTKEFTSFHDFIVSILCEVAETYAPAEQTPIEWMIEGWYKQHYSRIVESKIANCLNDVWERMKKEEK